MGEYLARRFGSLSLDAGDIVVIVGLLSESARQHNFQAARVVPGGSGERVGVCLLHGTRKTLSVKRRNLLRASVPEDRAMLLTRIVWEHQQELRVVRQLLLDQLRGEEGLCLHIASFFPVRETMALTTGFAHGRIVPAWSCARLRRGRLEWAPIHGKATAVFGAENVTNGITRIDCAVVEHGPGKFLVAGGCDRHPSVAKEFFSSAFTYDAITHAATPLPPMPLRRHGCGGTCIDGKVYVVGGEYVPQTSWHVDPPPQLVSVFDLARGEWSALEEARWPEAVQPAELQQKMQLHAGESPVAFAPVGSCWGRLLLFYRCRLLAFNPMKPQAGWRQAGPSSLSLSRLGQEAQSCTCWGDRVFVISSGRPGDGGLCEVMAFEFTEPPDSPDDCAWDGVFTHLGKVDNMGGRIGCGLTVVQDRLYISGGVDEGDGDFRESRGFDASTVRWTGRLKDLRAAPAPDLEPVRGQPLFSSVPDAHLRRVRDCTQFKWEQVDELRLPTPMHAHSAINVPMLPCGRLWTRPLELLSSRSSEAGVTW